MRIVYLSLGSNLGNREEALQIAVTKLHCRGCRVRRISSVYETAPVDNLDQPDFLNIVVEAESDLFPLQLLQRVAKVEREMGRKRLISKGPRTIDIDILLHGPFIVDTSDLQIPHPRMTERRFVLEPLAELVPELRHPVYRRTVKELLVAAPSQRLVKTPILIALPAGGIGDESS